MRKTGRIHLERDAFLLPFVPVGDGEADDKADGGVHRMSEQLPIVPVSNCACSFCMCIYTIGDKDLEPRDKLLFERHLILHHGLRFCTADELR